MKYNKIVLAGGSGHLGKVLANYYKDKATEIVIFSRKAKAPQQNIRTVKWDAQTKGDWAKELVNADILINLCGKNVNCRYTPENKAEIIASRVIPTELLGITIKQMTEPPKLWINMSSATIYRHAEDRPQDEETGEIGYGFSIEVCKAWEGAFDKYDTPNTRKVNIRMGIVLGREGSVFPRLLNLVKIGFGGKQGNGKQYIAWVHEHDAARSTEYFAEHEELSGTFNCTAPVPIKNAEMMATIRRLYGMPFGLPAPQWLLAIGAIVIGTEPELILKSRWVVPKRLLDAGFTFQYRTAEEAVGDILSIRM